MKFKKMVVFFLAANMLFGFTSCTRQTEMPKVEHSAGENSTVQEQRIEEESGEDESSLDKDASEETSGKTETPSDQSQQETNEQPQNTEQSDQTGSDSAKTEEEDTPDDTKQTDNNKEETAKQQDLSAYESFVNPLKYAYILDKPFSAEKPFLQECAPEILYNWCHIVLSIFGESEPETVQGSDGMYYYKAEDVERTIEQYYGMSKEQLQTSPSYSSEVNGYLIPQGRGGFLPYYTITDVQEDGDLLVLHYDVYDYNESVSSKQRLTIQKTGSDSWKYIENVAE